MPEAVRATVRRLVETARKDHADTDGRFLGFPLHGGPTGGDFLDADGELWSWWVDDTVEHVPDGPRKVASVAIAAELVPELAAWLPRRPATACDCPVCNQTGSLPPPWPAQWQCAKCFGMGWLSG